MPPTYENIYVSMFLQCEQLGILDAFWVTLSIYKTPKSFLQLLELYPEDLSQVCVCVCVCVCVYVYVCVFGAGLG